MFFKFKNIFIALSFLFPLPWSIVWLQPCSPARTGPHYIVIYFLNYELIMISIFKKNWYTRKLWLEINVHIEINANF